ncbi:RDD family protein [Pandoraea sp. PE-S2R-1]|uniref:RDD family protein n=1 Tax=Pandoraea sp. PE-S2R-1 TaxID=1986994 RepID=UPI00148398B5|nr:RDD family protein [Pandoraea sp. PE-S2R-1]
MTPDDGVGGGQVGIGSPPPLPPTSTTFPVEGERIAATPPPLPPSQTPTTAPVEFDTAGALRRFGARYIDQLVAAFLVVIISSVVLVIVRYNMGAFPGAGLPPLIASALLGSAWSLGLLVADSMIRAMFGNTLGKKLLKLEVVDRDGHRLSRLAYFKRNVYLWVWGFGFGIWFFALIMPVVQLWRIGHGKATMYDGRLGTQVRALGPLSKGRKVVAATPFLLFAAYIVCMFLIGALYNRSDEISPIHRTWVNPITRNGVGLPDGWVDHTQSVPPTDSGLAPVVAFEDSNGSMGILLYCFTVHRSTLQDRARAYMDGNAGRLDFDDGGIFESIGPAWERWTVRAVSHSDKVPRTVTIYRHDNDYWLLTAIDRVGTTKESPKLKDLRDRVAQTILGRPQP